ncbi:C4-dicarboxylate ABC transporter [Marinomonas ushuaiensis DSM 15871]|uniref:C4-dicarboxylate ABC transporter n=1 Tax=Marinomonas ushuaiensis DSM 15871 TaxID=1122207 RepID=X7E9G3_9GAMM|nr:YfcC family protein [Marinomonas ushuaiensis]ETX11831.1 C4-dicarboxylate ABC transporter [Marinomonas ushuaiensis DSM 15871]
MTFKFPTAYTILFLLIALLAAGTWVVPAGQYERVENVVLGKEIPVPGTYQQVDANPQGVVDVLLAPIAGFYNPDSYEAAAIDVALFVLIIGGFLGVVTNTGAIDTGISQAMVKFKGHEKWMIPILMALFALGGSTYGMAEESLAFYALLIPIMIAAGYDSLVAVAIILLGAGIGCLGSTINPFATVIAANAADIPFTQGIGLRLFILFSGWLACVIYVMRYAEKIHKDPSLSIVADHRDEIEAQFSKEMHADNESILTLSHKIVLVIFALTFAVMIWGVSSQGWWMAKMGALFIASAILIGFVTRMGEKSFTEVFINGARDLLGVAIIIGIARGIVVVMDAGNMTDTILHLGEETLSGLSSVVFINAMFGIEVLMSFFVPSSSGLAVLSMPIMAPLADFSGVGRELVVTAYQSANGLVNLFNPTFAVVMGGLAIAKVPYERWLRFVWPLLLILCLIIMGSLSVAAFIA